MGKYVGAFPIPKKKKNKTKHISNPRITEYTDCELCGKNNACETHEIWGASNRNLSISKGWQVKVCRKCHERCHTEAKFDLKLKAKWQRKIMAEEMIFDFDEWRNKYRLKNYIIEE